MEKYFVDRNHKKIVKVDEFKHHGIMGQKWGVITRNVGVNYIPTGERIGGKSKVSTNSSSSRKTNKEMTMKQRLKYWSVQSNRYNNQYYNDAYRKSTGSNNGENRKLGKHAEEGQDRSHILTEDAMRNQMSNRIVRNVLIAGLTGLNVADAYFNGVTPYNVYLGILNTGLIASKVYDSYAHKSGLAKDDARRESLPVDKKTGFHMRTDNDPANKDLDRVNPGKRVFNGDANCPGCAVATELRQRGYDVRARDFDGISATQSMLNGFKNTGNRKVTDIYKQDVGTTAYKLSKIGENPDCTTATMKALSKEPEGSRGFLFMSYGRGGGHVTNYFIEGGKPRIYEGQLGRKLGPAEYGPLLKSCYYTSYTRVDDLPINVDICKEVVE